MRDYLILHPQLIGPDIAHAQASQNLPQGAKRRGGERSEHRNKAVDRK